MGDLRMKINGKEVTAKKFAFEGCHKIYIIDTPEEEAQALKYGYDIYPIEEIKEAYEGSCSLKFISNWPLDDKDIEGTSKRKTPFVSYVAQFENATFEGVENE
jgi:hypothetical protein